MQTGLAVAGSVAAIGRARAAGDDPAGNGAAAAREKLSPEAVHYQPMPKDGEKYGQKCLTCMYFQAPGTCSVVSGTVSPQGWCTAYSLLHE
jgi:hypothetical protein